MSNVWTPTNQGRVDKITDLLDKLIVSAASNKADELTMSMMLAPVTAKLGQLVGSAAPQPVAAPVQSDHTKRRDITLWDEAKTAPLNELMLAWSTINSRLMDAVDEGSHLV